MNKWDENTDYVAEANALLKGDAALRYRRPKGECKTCDEHGDGMMPSHTASDNCQSGKRNHCTCDACF